MDITRPVKPNYGVREMPEGYNYKQSRKVKCRRHESDQIKFICKDCNEATCCTINHKACKNVVNIKTMIPEMKTALSHRRYSLERKMMENKSIVRKVESKIKQLQNSKQRLVTDIKSATESIITYLRMNERELLNKLSDAFDKQIAQHHSHEKAGQIKAQMYQQHCEFIDQALQSESEMDMYDVYQICTSEAIEQFKMTESDTGDTCLIGEVKLTLNVEPLKKAISEMGEVDFRLSSVPRRKNKHEVNALSNLKLNGNIDIKHRDDCNQPDPVDVTAVTVSGEDTIVVADYANNCLKSVSTKMKKQEISKLKVSCRPFRVVTLPGQRIAATVEGSHIVVAEVRPELVLISNLKTRKYYIGLTSLPDSTLAAGSFSPPGIDILNLKGNVLRSFFPHSVGLDLIQFPNYICTTQNGNILVSDWGSTSVYSLTSQGNVALSCKPTGDTALMEPRGITVTNTGDILLAVSGPNKITQLKSEGTFVRNILPPTCDSGQSGGIFVDGSNKLYLCDRTPGSECIKVFAYT